MPMAASRPGEFASSSATGGDERQKSIHLLGLMRARVIAAVAPVHFLAFGGELVVSIVEWGSGGGGLAANGFAPPQEPLTDSGVNTSDADEREIFCHW